MSYEDGFGLCSFAEFLHVGSFGFCFFALALGSLIFTENELKLI